MDFSKNYTLEFKINIKETIHLGKICTNKKLKYKEINRVTKVKIKYSLINTVKY